MALSTSSSNRTPLYRRRDVSCGTRLSPPRIIAGYISIPRRSVGVVIAVALAVAGAKSLLRAPLHGLACDRVLDLSGITADRASGSHRTDGGVDGTQLCGAGQRVDRAPRGDGADRGLDRAEP